MNSINDTEEAGMVATILEGVYYDMVSTLDLKEVRDVFKLWDGRVEAPATMMLPTYVMDVEEVKYNGQLLAYMSLKNALKIKGNSTQTITTAIGETWEIPYNNNADPTSFTVIDDTLMVFNSCRNDKLMPSKTLCFGSLYPQFNKRDDFVLPLSPQHMRLFLNKAKVRAFGELKEAQNQEAAGEARQQKIAVSRQKDRIPDASLFSRRPTYGRSRRFSGR